MPRILDFKGLVMRRYVGEAEASDGSKMTLYANMDDSPLIYVDGKYVSFPWSDLLGQAIELTRGQTETPSENG